MTPDTAPEQPTQQGGVLATLPRTRPQRPSARRAAARRKAKSETTDTAPAATAPAKASRARTRAKPPQDRQRTTEAAAAPRARARAKATGKADAKRSSTRAGAGRAPKARLTAVKPPEPAVPKQGYEPEEEVELGKPVSPPSGLELVESLVAVVGELAGGSLSAGGRLLKDALSGLRRP